MSLGSFVCDGIALRRRALVCNNTKPARDEAAVETRAAVFCGECKFVVNDWYHYNDSEDEFDDILDDGDEGGGVENASEEQLECARILIEAGADVNARNAFGQTPLFYLHHWADAGDRSLFASAPATLVAQGGDVNARDSLGKTMVFEYATPGRLWALRLLVKDYGASVNVIADNGWTPLMAACKAVASDWANGNEDEDEDNADDQDATTADEDDDGEATTTDEDDEDDEENESEESEEEEDDDDEDEDKAKALVLELLAASSGETRNSTLRRDRRPRSLNAVDMLAEMAYRLLSRDETRPHWTEEVVGELYRGGAPVTHHNARKVLPIAMALAERRRAEAEAARAQCTGWRWQEALVGLSFDARDAREADERVAAKKARVREVKEQLRARGEEVSDHEGDEDEEEEEDGGGGDGGEEGQDEQGGSGTAEGRGGGAGPSDMEE